MGKMPMPPHGQDPVLRKTASKRKAVAARGQGGRRSLSAVGTRLPDRIILHNASNDRNPRAVRAFRRESALAIAFPLMKSIPPPTSVRSTLTRAGTRVFLMLLVFSGYTAPAADAPRGTPYLGVIRGQRVDSWTGDWLDAKRDRTVPVKIYFPASSGKDTREPCPVILFSHGLGGSREHYRYLGEHWAAHGYVSVHLQHPGSDETIWKDQSRPLRTIGRAAADPGNVVHRPLDVRFALDRLAELNDDAAFVLHRRLDLQRVGVAGHSFGAYTTMAVAGQTLRRLPGVELAEPRVKAAIAMSTPVRNPTAASQNNGYGEVAIPVYHLTGSADADRFGTPDPALRRVPYDQTRRAPACLLVLTGGDHMVFSGQRRRGDGEHDPEFHRLILESTTAFWDATLRDSPEAQRWLDDDFSERLGDLGTFEQKRPAS
jgi:predicted dienelactone hydrolase